MSTKSKSEILDNGASKLVVAGSGTFIIGVAQFIPEDSFWKKFVIFLAPWITIYFSSFRDYLASQYNDWDYKRKIVKAKNNIESKISDNNVADEQKEEFMKDLTELHRMDVDYDINKVKEKLSTTKKIGNYSKSK